MSDYDYYGYFDGSYYKDFISFDLLYDFPENQTTEDCKLPKVGDRIYALQSQGLPLGSILRAENGELFVRGSQYNDGSYFLMSLQNEIPRYSVSKFTILYLPEWPKSFEVGDVVSHAQAQSLPRFTVLTYEPDEWMKRHCPNGLSSSSSPFSHWFVTNKVVSARCGVVKPMAGEDHWATFYKIVYLPGQSD